MASPSSNEVFDLLIVIDATASMAEYIRALNQSLQDIIRISVLTDCFERIGILAYRDYNATGLIEWSSWYSVNLFQRETSQADLIRMAARLGPRDGGDWPEASKTCLAEAYNVMRSDATTIMLLYTDAPPHLPCNHSDNLVKEKIALEAGGRLRTEFADWVSGCRIFSSGDKKAVAFCLVHSHLADTLSPYLFLSTLTGGATFRLERNRAAEISEITMSILLTWMGMIKGGSGSNGASSAASCFGMRYRDIATIDKVQHEDDDVMEIYFLKRDVPESVTIIKDNLDTVRCQSTRLSDFIQPRATPVRDLSARYVADESYRYFVSDQMQNILMTDVRAVVTNPIFGVLWRTICKDRASQCRAGLINVFSEGVNRLTDVADKARMKAWLAESYNFAAECDDTIAEVAEEDRYPCFFLDPTLNFMHHADNDGGDPASGEVATVGNCTLFSREELLEIGRSCDPRVLRRLGKVLTQITYAHAKVDEPAHIRDLDSKQITRLPIALARPQYKRTFWQILLHLILPGTKVSARVASLLAALSLRMGIEPFRAVAESQLLNERDSWNDMEISETWNASCLSLLLEADRNYESRISNGTSIRPAPDCGVLTAADRALFRTLTDYRLLELNLGTTLTARVGWTPDRSRVALGPIVICPGCEYPRSVTVMGTGGKCGFCIACDTSPSKCPCQLCFRSDDADEHRQIGVSSLDSAEATKTWVECGVRSCRAQYVVYNVEGLRVRAKCFYCRHKDQANPVSNQSDFGPAPVVECIQCLNRVIWPTEYRPGTFDPASFLCYACSNGVTTIVDVETTAKAIADENGTECLLRNEELTIEVPFDGRTIHRVASNVDRATFATKVTILPLCGDADAKIRHKNKQVHNTAQVFDALARWINSRSIEAGECSVCFSAMAKAKLQAACGRKGCQQRVCRDCAREWYGINRPGHIINVAALACPFCRRLPAPKTVSPFHLTNITGLCAAVDEVGSWIHAWCVSCSGAKRLVERVCAVGAPPEVANFECDECETGRLAKSGADHATVRMCPSCETATERTGGCGHMTCTACGNHWCWFCTTAVDVANIYRHMSKEHGGMFGEVEDDEAEDDEVEDDD